MLTRLSGRHAIRQGCRQEMPINLRRARLCRRDTLLASCLHFQGWEEIESRHSPPEARRQESYLWNHKGEYPKCPRVGLSRPERARDLTIARVVHCAVCRKGADYDQDQGKKIAISDDPFGEVGCSGPHLPISPILMSKRRALTMLEGSLEHVISPMDAMQRRRRAKRRVYISHVVLLLWRQSPSPQDLANTHTT